MISLNLERLPLPLTSRFPPLLGRSLGSSCLPFPSPQPAGVHRNQKGGTCLMQSCLKSYIFSTPPHPNPSPPLRHFQDHLSSGPGMAPIPPIGPPASQSLAALSEIDIRQLSSRSLPPTSCLNIYFTVLPRLSLYVQPCPKFMNQTASPEVPYFSPYPSLACPPQVR